MFSKLSGMIAILAALYLQQATCLPKPQLPDKFSPDGPYPQGSQVPDEFSPDGPYPPNQGSQLPDKFSPDGPYPATQGGYYPPMHTQPSFPPLAPPRTASPNWRSKLRCSGQINGLDYSDCQNAFKGLIDQSYPGGRGQWISSPRTLKTSRYGSCKATVSCDGRPIAVDAGVLYYDTTLQGGANALLERCVRTHQSAWAVIENACSVAFEPSSSQNYPPQFF